MEKTNEHLEIIYSQIDTEARAIAKKATGYDPDTDEELGQYKPKQVAYEHIVKYYKAGAIPYGEKLANMQEMKERYEKALKAICGDNGDTIPAKHDMIALARIALTPKTSDDDTANG